jgi:hypothetical protein
MESVERLLLAESSHSVSTEPNDLSVRSWEKQTWVALFPKLHTKRRGGIEMNADKVNKWLTLITNVVVIVGIVFLALELRKNSDLMKAQSRTTMSQDIVNLLTLDIGNAEFVE